MSDGTNIQRVQAEPIMPADSMTDALAAGQAMQRVAGRYTTAIAVQRPRRLSEVQRKLEEEADLAAESFFYGWGSGRDRIEGPSVQLALAAARCYGNCAIELLPVQETSSAWIFTAAFVDLETGFTLSRQFRQSKDWVIHGKFDEARKTDIRFQIGQSKALRNVIINAVPRGLVNKAKDRAKAGVKARVLKFVDSKGLVFAAETALKSLAKHGITEDRVLAKFDIADRKALDVDMLVTISGDISALDEGQEYPDELYPPVGSADPATPTDGPAEGKHAFGFTKGKRNGGGTVGGPDSAERQPRQSTQSDGEPAQPGDEAEQPQTPSKLTWDAFHKQAQEIAIEKEIASSGFDKAMKTILVANGWKGQSEKADPGALATIIEDMKSGRFSWPK